MPPRNLEAELAAEIPKIRRFLAIPQKEIAAITGTDTGRWSRYFNGMTLGEKALENHARLLKMQPYSLLWAIQLRREGYRLAELEPAPKLVL